ncbi:MAG: hypothetical protein GYA31_02705 [Parcubacteria group bacterium]|nr:hypothetical protein [Parcubacteria group bacterium]
MLVGDFGGFILGLGTAIFIRYGFVFNGSLWRQSCYYFIPVFLIWLLIFFIFRLYELIYLANRKEFFERMAKISLINIISAVIYFYSVSFEYYRPSLVLVLTVFFSLLFVFLWRIIANKLLGLKKIKVVLKSIHPRAEELKQIIEKNPQLGYEINEGLNEDEKTIVIIDELDSEADTPYCRHLPLEEFYELICQKVSLDLISLNWFNEARQTNRIYYEVIKNVSDRIFGFLFFLVTLPLWPVIAFLIKIDSSGEIIYRSQRIGRNKKPFSIYKFRTMVEGANKIGPAWTEENDTRITRMGKFLRKTHLDELPQVLNIIKGDISFVGPRPEEEALTKLYEKEIPYYEYRFLMKPGVVGWAQINYPQSASLEDARKKYEYDLYYLKYRNLIFDFIIALKAWRIPLEIPTH